MLKRPVSWIALGLLAVVLTVAAYRGFPLAFSIVSVDISMDRAQALAAARTIAAADALGPANYREAASFELDDETQTFVELEGGGKDAFTAMLRHRWYLAYTWHVRHFREGEVDETTITLAPDGQPYGFEEHIREDAPGPALGTEPARQIAERDAAAHWGVDLGPFHLVERGQTRRPGGRVDHTFVYERATPTLNEGRYRVRLVVSGDRLTAVTPFVKVPDAFLRRYDSMRAANTTLGLVSVIGMIVVYGVVGMGFGLFTMGRLRWIVWRPAAVWGMAISAVQALVAVNEWPLVWMAYDTATTRTLFVTQQALGILASFVSFSLIYTVSFMTAETLTRRAFGSHPQLWRVWAREPGASVEVLGRTVAGYLLVTVFFAYDVALYLFATHRLGWWSPSEALFHPDVLAAYFPWFSAIANSLQAGFWEECLFRAVPIAGAALIGNWLGYRKTAIVIAFAVQAVIFGSGHAPYPNEPFYARPVELILPSIGFGLLYLYFGLVPGIILHFTFDTTWFAIPLFVAHAPGIWIQRLMVVAVVLVPLWVVLWRRVQVGHWTHLQPDDRNAAWAPPPVVAAPVRPPVVVAARQITPGAERLWLALGAAGLAVCLGAAVWHRASEPLPIGREQAIVIARQALAAQGVVLGPAWRFIATPEDGSGGAQEFVSETAGEARRRALLGVFLPKPRWDVRAETFEGDVALRAEDWRIFVTATGEARPIIHDLPEASPGATLTEPEARSRAEAALAARLHLEPQNVREVSATPNKLAARTDWTFVFTDLTVPALPAGEPRARVDLAGDEVTAVSRFIFVPEAWERQASATQSRNLIFQIAFSLIPVGALVTLAVFGIVAWSRRRYTPRLFLVALLQFLVIGGAVFRNNWPVMLANLSTSQPYGLQVGGLVAAGFVALLISAAVPALVLGGVPASLPSEARLSERMAVRLGVAAGFIGTAIVLLAAWLRTPVWAQASDVGPLGTSWPIVAVVLPTLSTFLTRMALLVGLLASIRRQAGPSGRRWWTGAFEIGFVGAALAGTPAGAAFGGWLAAVGLCAVALLLLSGWLFAFDLTMVPVALGVMGAVEAVMTGFGRAYPGALTNELVAAVGLLVFAWWWFRLLRRSTESRATETAVAA